jgi:single-stranded DNA-binding protein
LPFLVKGRLVYAEGIPSANAYMNKENQAAASIEMRVIRVELLGAKDSADEARVQTTSQTVRPTESPLPNTENIQTPPTPVSEPEDDLPF